MFAKIDGMKTYIGMLAAGGLGIALSMGWVEWAQVKVIATLVATWTGVAITHKANKAVKALGK